MVVRPNKKICVQVTVPTPIFYPLLNFFSKFWSNCSSAKENGRQGMHFKGFFIFDMNPTALRKAKIVHNFGLSDCNRVERKSVVLSKDIKIIFFFFLQYFLIFLTVKCRYMNSEETKKVFKKKKKIFPTYLP